MNDTEHFQKLLHFALLGFRGELQTEVTAMREHYAHVTIGDIRPFFSIRPTRVLEVGGANGATCKAFNEEFGAEVVNLEPQAKMFQVAQALKWDDTICGVAQALPFSSNSFDLVICRSVLEHIPSKYQQNSVNEMYRVTKEGGLCYVAVPPWYNPFAGHEFRPFHLFPFKLAKRFAMFFHPTFPQASRAALSYQECSLYPITFKKISRMISVSGFRVLARKDMHFRMHFLTKIPIIREIAVPNVALILQK